MAKINDKHVFTIWGAPGGGKSTLAVNMATVLADSGYMTCLVSATDHGELQAFFGASIPKDKGIYAALSSGRNVRDAVTKASENLCILELDTGGDAFNIMNITGAQVKNMIEDLRDQFTYVIIDGTSYKESAFTGVGLADADKVVVCIPHRATAATWHIANAQMFEAIGPKTVYIDCDTRPGGCQMEQLLASICLPECPVKIKYVSSAYSCENSNVPIVRSGSGRQEKEYKRSVMQLLSLLLELEDDDNSTTRKKEKVQKDQARGISHAEQESKAPTTQKKKKLLGEVKVREEDGRTKTKLSPRQLRKAEEEAMRQAKAEVQRRFEEQQ